MKLYTSTEIHAEFDKLSKAKQVETLWAALDFMQQYNGRSRTLCMAMAMGYDNDEGDDKSYYKQ